MGKYFISLETVIIRKTSLLSLDEWFDESFELIEEYDLFARICYNWKIDYVDEVLAKWRVHSDSWTWKKSELFPIERKLLLDKLEKKILNFKTIYKTEIGLVYRRSARDYFFINWKKRNNKIARSYIKPIYFFRL